jgi:hypothetical protein
VRLTTLLASVANIPVLLYNPTDRVLTNPPNPALYAMYENQLIQAAFLSRCAYMPTTLFMKCMKFMDRLDIQEDVITIMERYHYLRYNFQDLFVAPNPTETTSVPHGAFFPRTGCTVFEYHAPESSIQSKRALYVVFKGSSSIRDFKNDLALIKTPLSKIPELCDLAGTTHGGFYSHMKDEVADILETVKTYAATAEVVYVTGHSLGGAMATLFGMMLANAREKGDAIPVIHTITFGAPNLFSDDARNEFNRFLLKRIGDDPILTLTRVVSGATDEPINDYIVSLPGLGYSHPGFDVSKAGRYFDKTFEKTGRTPSLAKQRQLYSKSPSTDSRLVGVLKDPARLESVAFLREVLGPDAKITKDDIITPEINAAEENIEKEAAKGVAELEGVAAKEEAAEAAEDTAAAGTMVGGGITTWSFTKSGRAYKKCAEILAPNVVKILCRSPVLFCHGIYAGLGFMGALRFPPGVLTKDPSTGKIRFKAVAKKEPVYKTLLMGGPAQIDGIYSPVISKTANASPSTSVQIPSAMEPQNHISRQRAAGRTNHRLTRRKRVMKRHTRKHRK